MSTAVTTPTAAAQPARTDLVIVWWTLPVFYTLFGLIFVVLTRVMPPPRPDKPVEQIVDFFAEHTLTIKLGFGVLMVVIGWAAWANGLIAYQITRMSVGSVWAYAYIGALAVGAVPGCLLAAFAFLAAVLRPDRDPQLLALLYDVGLLTFVGSLGCFSTAYLVFALAVFLDRNGVFPTWIAYVTIWQIVTEIMAAPVFLFTDGAFAWDGSISFWMGTAIFGFWEGCLIALLLRAVRQDRAGERVDD
ncbi:hypothetical protein LV457_17995 [Mycobacterium sp. MYCO198283]|uniref:hypothetical protein n=1 Tax=Mycobacterium sp. MYCO198283 TaxID=2883505 RepID=UPI001E3434FE|nr:hypothetical protein [Mycobacterium sp. MYCO198283]MCG5434166.1 hypothetical protein [Mycobacterium sp. MYCO198283]